MARVRFCLRSRCVLPYESRELAVSLEDTNVLVHDSRHRADFRRYYFDNVFGEEATSTDIFHEVLVDNVPGLFEGASSTIFLHGATGSGKTHTSEGTPDEVGLVELLLAAIFEVAREPQYKGRYQLSYSLFEIHCDKVRDLLGTKTDLPMRVNHQDNLTIPGLQWTVVDDPIDDDAPRRALAAYREGVTKRRVARTKLNSESSRSHCCLRVRVELIAQDGAGETANSVHAEIARSKGKKKDVMPRVVSRIEFPPAQQVGNLFVIDLAGAENNSKTGNAGLQLEESCAINSNHFQLGQVLNALKHGKHPVPYRNSKMTRLLRSCFKEEGYTVMLVTISPSVSALQATMNSFQTIALDGFSTRDGRPRARIDRPSEDGVSLAARPLTARPKQSPRPATKQSPRSARASSCGGSSRWLTFPPSSRASSCGPPGSARQSRTRVSNASNAPSVLADSTQSETQRNGARSSAAKRDDEQERMVKQVWENVQEKLDHKVQSLYREVASYQQGLDQAVLSKISTEIQKKTGNMTLAMLNYGTVADLVRLKGVDEAGANAILAHRQACGAFNVLEDVLAVASLSRTARTALGAVDEEDSPR
eukprot:GEMP01008753.1.p1 GENE.GEMP01008753.1~~GEMP01008753.1.p1  ORF type:complete len:599 (+),score=161.71 GEMP01008753.1:23-1798(+)